MSERETRFFIVGGLPRTGKTTVSNRISHELQIGSIETDHIRTLFNPTASSKLRTHSGVDIPTVTRKMRPRLESLIDSLMINQTDIILNGECIDPHMIVESPHREHFSSCFMGLNNPEATFTRIREIADPKDWAMYRTDDELKEILANYAARSTKLANLCMKLTLPYIDASEDFGGAHEQAYATLTQPNN